MWTYFPPETEMSFFYLPVPTLQVLYGGCSAAQGAFVQLLGLLAEAPPAQPQTENGTRQHTGLLGEEEAINPVQRNTGKYVRMYGRDECHSQSR